LLRMRGRHEHQDGRGRHREDSQIHWSPRFMAAR
jgi:hypothetical protein